MNIHNEACSTRGDILSGSYVRASTVLLTSFFILFRLAVEDSTAVVYHTMENSRIFREFHIEAVEISLEVCFR